MFNIQQKITSGTAKAMQAARDSVKQTIRDETKEFIKSASQQGVPVSEKPFEAPKFELFPEIKEVNEEERKQIQEQSSIRLQRLEEELKQLRMQRQQTDQEWAKRQQEIMNPEDAARAAGQVPPRKEIIIPTSKPTGPNAQQAAVKAKQGSREVGRQKST
jgi:hypothetical protein